MVRKRKGEAITLYCSHCTWSTELDMAKAEQTQVVPCAHCGEPLYWHRCDRCGLCYVGGPEPFCAICDDSSLDDLTTD